MALLLMDGFDIGDSVLKWGAGGSSSINRFGAGRSVTHSNTNGTRRFTPSTQVFVGYAWYQTVIDTANAFSNASMSLYTDTGVTQHLTVTFISTALQLRRGGSGGTVIATYPTTFLTGAFYSFEVSATIDSTVGTCIVKLGGTIVINFTGNTRNGGTSTNIDTISIGNGWAGLTANFDDLYVCDSTGSAPYNTFLGDVRVVTLSPTAAGSSTQLTPDSGSNYTRVNEAPYSAANYVSGATPGLRDMYTLSDLPAGTANVFAVQSNVIAKRTSTGAIAVKPAIKSGASVYYGSPLPTTTNDATVSDLRTTDPNTSAAWTVGGVNALEAGLEIV